MILILMMVMIVMEYFWVEVTMMEMSVGGAGDTYIFLGGGDHVIVGGGGDIHIYTGAAAAA